MSVWNAYARLGMGEECEQLLMRMELLSQDGKESECVYNHCINAYQYITLMRILPLSTHINFPTLHVSLDIKIASWHNMT